MVKYEKKLSKVKAYEQAASNASSNYNALVPYKRNNKLLRILFIITCIIIFLALSAFLLFKFVILQPDMVFKKALDELKNRIENEKIITDFDSVHSILNIDANVDLSTASEKILTDEMVNNINNTDIEINIDKNADEDRTFVDFDLIQDSSDIKIKSVITSERIYVLLDDIFDRYIYADFDEKINSMISSKDSKYVKCFGKVIDSLSYSLKKEYFVQSKNDEGTKNTLILNSENIREIIKNSIANLKEDITFLDVLSEILGTPIPTLKTELERYSVELENNNIIGENESIEISIFTEGLNNINKIQVDYIKDSKVIDSAYFKVISDFEFEYSLNYNDEKIKGKVKEEKNANTSKVIFEINSDKYGNANLEIKNTTTLNAEFVKKEDYQNATSLKELTLQNTETILNNIKNNKILFPIFDIIYGERNIVSNNENLSENVINSPESEVSENVVKKDDVKVEFNVATGYTLDEKYSSEIYKYYDSSDGKVHAYITISTDSEKDYFNNIKKYDYEYKIEESEKYYTNVILEDIVEVKTNNDKYYKWQKLIYNAGNKAKYEKIYVFYKINDKYSYIVEIEAKNSTISESILDSFCNISLK